LLNGLRNRRENARKRLAEITERHESTHGKRLRGTLHKRKYLRMMALAPPWIGWPHGGGPL
jgi:hypothetical protein